MSIFCNQYSRLPCWTHLPPVRLPSCMPPCFRRQRLGHFLQKRHIIRPPNITLDGLSFSFWFSFQTDLSFLVIRGFSHARTITVLIVISVSANQSIPLWSCMLIWSLLILIVWFLLPTLWLHWSRNPPLERNRGWWFATQTFIGKRNVHVVSNWQRLDGTGCHCRRTQSLLTGDVSVFFICLNLLRLGQKGSIHKCYYLAII